MSTTAASVRRKHERLVRSLRHQGPSITIWKLLKKFVPPLRGLSLWMLHDLDVTTYSDKDYSTEGLVIRQATEKDVEKILFYGNGVTADANASAADSSHDQPARRYLAELFRERIESGDICFMAMSGSDVVHVNWMCFDWGDAMPGFLIELAPDEFYTTDCYTVKSWRGKDVHDVVKNQMLLFAQQAGYRHAYTLTELERAGARAGLRRLGYRVAARVLCIDFAGRQRLVPLTSGMRKRARQSSPYPTPKRQAKGRNQSPLMLIHRAQ